MNIDPDFRAARVQEALDRYRADQMDVSAGYNVLRFAKAGHLKIQNPAFAEEFMAWYPTNPDYLVLRMAAAGQLVYQPAAAASLVIAEEKNERAA